MGLVTTTALCLRKVDFSETSQILTLLTADQGVIGAIAKGAKREKSNVGGPLDLMCLYQVVLYDRSHRDALSILSQAELINFFPGARRDYERFRCMQSLRELLLAVDLGRQDGAAPLLLIAVLTLRSLATEGPWQPAMARFAQAMLRLMGSEPVVTHCVVSGKEPSGKVKVKFSVNAMGLLAPPHTNSPEARNSLVTISPPTLAALQSLALGLDGEPDPRISIDGWKGAFTLLAGLIAMQAGRQLKTVAPLGPGSVL